MPFVDDPNQNSNDTSVAGATPLGQPQAQSETPQQNTSQEAASSAPAQIGADQGAQTTNNRSPKASSGMFKNIQKYVEKNRPQAQNMAGAVTQDFSKQAANIRQVAEQKQAQQQQTLQANQQALTENRNWADQQVQNIMGGQEQIAAPSQEEQDRFQALSQGNIAGVGNVQDLNLTKQQMRVDELQRLAQGANQEEGRRELLGQTFSKQGDYTRGMSGLDQLITSGDQAAREALITGTQGTSEQIGQDVDTIAQQARQAASAQRGEIQNFGQDITGLASGAQEGIQSDIESAYQQALSERQALLDPESEAYQAALQAAQTRLDPLANVTGSLGDFTNYIQNQMKKGVGLGWQGRDYANLEGALEKLNEYEKTGQIVTRGPMGVPKILKGTEAQNYLRERSLMDLSHHKEREQIRELVDNINKSLVGSDQDLYGLDKLARSGKGDLNLYNMFENLQQQYKGLGSAEDVVQKRLAREAGIGFDELAQGSDIGQYDVADQAEIDRINALKQLMGQEDLITEQQLVNRDYTGLEDIQNILNKYAGK